MLETLIEAFRKGLIEGERELAVVEFGQAMLVAVADAQLTDAEVDDLCALYDRLNITLDEWNVLRLEVWAAACKAAAENGITRAELRELRGIRAFLGPLEAEDL